MSNAMTITSHLWYASHCAWMLHRTTNCQTVKRNGKYQNFLLCCWLCYPLNWDSVMYCHRELNAILMWSSVSGTYLYPPCSRLYQKQVWRAETSNYIPWILWGVITCPCPWYLFLTHKSSWVQCHDTGSVAITLDGTQHHNILSTIRMISPDQQKYIRND